MLDPLGTVIVVCIYVFVHDSITVKLLNYSNPIKMAHIALIPGNYESKVDAIWFPSVMAALKEAGHDPVAKNMPDPMTARMSIWLPFIKDELGVDADAIGIGHSSGAIALLKLAETQKIRGIVLVGAYYTDLDDEMEKKSGYFDTPWDWEAIDKNTEFIIQFASTDDPYIPAEESRYLKTKLPKIKYIEYTDKGHMGEDIEMTEFSDLVTELLKEIGSDTK